MLRNILKSNYLKKVVTYGSAAFFAASPLFGKEKSLPNKIPSKVIFSKNKNNLEVSLYELYKGEMKGRFSGFYERSIGECILWGSVIGAGIGALVALGYSSGVVNPYADESSEDSKDEDKPSSEEYATQVIVGLAIAGAFLGAAACKYENKSMQFCSYQHILNSYFVKNLNK